MKKLLCAVLLATPAWSAAADAHPPAAPAHSQAQPPRQEREFLEWTLHRLDSLKLGDEAVESVLEPREPERRLWRLAAVIVRDTRVLRRYTTLIASIRKQKGRINPLDQDLCRRIWMDLRLTQDDIDGFTALARSLGIAEPEFKEAAAATAGAPAKKFKAGDRRYDPDTGDYEVFDGSGNWR